MTMPKPGQHGIPRDLLVAERQFLIASTKGTTLYDLPGAADA